MLFVSFVFYLYYIHIGCQAPMRFLMTYRLDYFAVICCYLLFAIKKVFLVGYFYLMSMSYVDVGWAYIANFYI